MLLDPLKTFVHIHSQFEISVHHKFFAETMAAIIGAHIGNCKSYAVIVLPGNAVGPYFFSVAIFFPDQIVWDAVTVLFLLYRRYDLFSNWAVGIIPIHQRSKVGSSTPLGVECCYTLFFFRGDVDVFFEFFEGIYTILQLFDPFFHYGYLLCHYIYLLGDAHPTFLFGVLQCWSIGVLKQSSNSWSSVS